MNNDESSELEKVLEAANLIQCSKISEAQYEILITESKNRKYNHKLEIKTGNDFLIFELECMSLNKILELMKPYLQETPCKKAGQRFIRYNYRYDEIIDDIMNMLNKRLAVYNALQFIKDSSSGQGCMF